MNSSATAASAPLRFDKRELLVDHFVSAWHPQRLLLVGELHGTNEVPQLVRAIVERAVHRGRVLLLLEMPIVEQAPLDAFMRSDGGEEATRALLAGAFWSEAAQDGRSSAAALALLVSVHELRTAGRPVEIVAYAPHGDDPDGRAYGLRMADAIRAALTRHRDAQAISLSGNYHNRISAPDSDPTSMVDHLRDLDPLSVAVFAASGSYWACDREFQCGPKQLRDAGNAHEQLTFADEPNRAGYHAVIRLARFSASQPAVAAVGD